MYMVDNCALVALANYSSMEERLVTERTRLIIFRNLLDALSIDLLAARITDEALLLWIFEGSCSAFTYLLKHCMGLSHHPGCCVNS